MQALSQKLLRLPLVVVSLTSTSVVSITDVSCQLTGLDLEDANSQSETVFSGIAEAIKIGLLHEDQIDTAVRRLMYVRLRTGEFDDPELQPYRKLLPERIRSAAHLNLTRRVAAKSLVLLVNHNKTLPLSPTKKRIAVIGPVADCQSCYYGANCLQGTFVCLA